jgi:hypothetical protein
MVMLENTSCSMETAENIIVEQQEASDVITNFLTICALENNRTFVFPLRGYFFSNVDAGVWPHGLKIRRVRFAS